ncbi:hypothetical protein HF086_016053 [Spodoptera exigua]|uniref:C2H2-type domain-containing protein n=1 Tax=Spodoptera exigua TaxID=7107 RepID=A0A922MNT4_SPOEX|nr:hypothetical protein HF086_016053 [Spodoptera exigua]
MYKCPYCNVKVASNELIVHSRTKRHKLLCKQDDGEDYFTYVVHSAYKCRIITYRINGTSSLLTPELYLKTIAAKVNQLLQMEVESNKHIKVNLELFCTYIITKRDEDEVITDLKSFNTKNVHLQISSDLSSYYSETCANIMKKCEEFQERDSGWTLEKIEFLEINVNKYIPMRGNSFIPLPDWIQRKHACVNVKNNDNACFFWAVVSALYPVDSNSDRPTSYPCYKTVFKTTGIDLPVSVQGIKRFEVLNKINVNVYGIEKNKRIIPMYISKARNYDRQVNLLFYENAKLNEGDLTVKKNKGTSAAVVRKLNFENYRKALDCNFVSYDNMYTFTSDKHHVYTQIKRKKVLSGDDDKRYITEDGVNTLAWGHYKIK